jgi:hypothetical protein
MPCFPGVYARPDSNVHQFGLKPPQELAHHYSGAWAVRCSLGTRDLREANDKARQLHAEWAVTRRQFMRHVRRKSAPHRSDTGRQFAPLQHFLAGIA